MLYNKCQKIFGLRKKFQSQKCDIKNFARWKTQVENALWKYSKKFCNWKKFLIWKCDLKNFDDKILYSEKNY